MKFYGISVGPGDWELMTIKAVRILESCKVIAVPKTKDGNTMALDIIKNVIDIRDKKIIYTEFKMSRNAEENKIQHIKNSEVIIENLKQNDVAMISIGDISVFSTFSYIADIVKKAGYDVEIVAGVPSFCAVAAVLNQSLTTMKKPLHIIPGSFEDIQKIKEYDGTKVIMKSGKRLDAVLSEIENKDYALVQNCGLKNEIIYRKGEDKNKISSSYFTTILVKED